MNAGASWYVALGSVITLFGSIATTWGIQWATNKRERYAMRIEHKRKVLDFQQAVLIEMQDTAGALMPLIQRFYLNVSSQIQDEDWVKASTDYDTARYELKKLMVRFHEDSVRQAIIDYLESAQEFLGFKKTDRDVAASLKNMRHKLTGVLNATGVVFRRTNKELEDLF